MYITHENVEKLAASLVQVSALDAVAVVLNGLPKLHKRTISCDPSIHRDVLSSGRPIAPTIGLLSTLWVNIWTNNAALSVPLLLNDDIRGCKSAALHVKSPRAETADTSWASAVPRRLSRR